MDRTRSPALRTLARAMLAALLSAGAAAQTPPPAPEKTAPAPSPEAVPAPAPEPAPSPAPRPSPSRAPSADGAADRVAGAGDAGAIAPLAWLEGCWRGSVNQREFREQWLPPHGGILVGAGQQTLRGRMQDYEFMRLEARPDGIYFSQFSSDRREISFKLASTANEDKDTIFAFANTVDAFPQRLLYRRGVDGWLFETIEGNVDGADRKVIYPLRRIDCESGEFILK